MTSKRADKLTETTDDGKIELSEKELNQVTGGRKAGANQQEYLKFDLKEALITGVTADKK